MNDLIKFTFDFFGHVLPGLIIIFSLSLLGGNINGLDSLINFIESYKFETTMATVIIITAYVTGFAVNPLGRYLYRSIGFKIWGNNVKNDVDMFISDKFVLVRQFSPNNFAKIEAWNTYCAMAHNLAVASLILFLVGIIKIFTIEDFTWLWLIVLLVAIILFFVFISRAVTFYHWAQHDLNATITALRLRNMELD